MHYLQTVVTTLQAAKPISQPGAFHCGDTIHPALQREWSGSETGMGR